MASPIEQYDAHRANNEFIFVVFYRGSWCPFCQAYLQALESLRPAITAAGGAVFTVTSQTADNLPAMRAASGYTGETIIDPENVLAKELARRGVIDVAISAQKGYAHGMVQPAVLVGGKEKVWYKWAIVPATMNLGGAKDRPLLDEVWANVHAEMQGKPKVHASVNTMGIASGLKKKLFG